MTSIRNLPLAVRLGGAFGALCLALAIVAFTGVHAMNGLKPRPTSSPSTTCAPPSCSGACRQRAKDNMSLVAQHLYVHDGDDVTKDGDRGRDRGQLGQEPGGQSGAGEAVRRHARRRPSTPSSPRSAPSSSRPRSRRSLRDRPSEERTVALDLRRARQERHGARARRRPLLEAANHLAAEGVGEARATAASGTRIIILIALLAVVLAVAWRCSVTRSVVRPVKTLGERMTSLDENCLTGLSTHWTRSPTAT